MYKHCTLLIKHTHSKPTVLQSEYCVKCLTISQYFSYSSKKLTKALHAAIQVDEKSDHFFLILSLLSELCKNDAHKSNKLITVHTVLKTKKKKKKWWNANSVYLSIFIYIIFYNCHQIKYLHSQYKLIETSQKICFLKYISDRAYDYLSTTGV